jgi:uncharacterized membrane protein YcaP (DUF421 family)
MEAFFNIDWNSVFVPNASILEIVIRGTIMYLAMFALLRVFRRQAGAVGMADLLVIVVIADAAQNGMTGEAKSVTEAVVLVSVIVLWDWIFDWLGFRSKFAAKVLDPEPLELVRNGRMLRKNMDQEMITEEELLAQLRLQGAEDVSEVKSCCLESNGKFSVIKFDPDKNEGNKDHDRAVH